jgi:hypothetical protein
VRFGWRLSCTTNRLSHTNVALRPPMSHASASNGLWYMKDVNQNAACNFKEEQEESSLLLRNRLVQFHKLNKISVFRPFLDVKIHLGSFLRLKF